MSDGAGLPFDPAVLRVPAGRLDPTDPATAVIVDQIRRSRRRLYTDDASSTPDALLAGWRELARSDDEVVFGGGLPPEMVTAVVRRQGRRGRWSVLTVARGAQLRAALEQMRASSFRLDPVAPPAPGDTDLRLLVTEQTNATGQFATGRFATPELFLGERQIVLRIFVRPLDGFQNKTVTSRETPVIVTLPEPVGAREVVDGAVFAQAS